MNTRETSTLNKRFHKVLGATLELCAQIPDSIHIAGITLRPDGMAGLVHVDLWFLRSDQLLCLVEAWGEPDWVTPTDTAWWSMRHPGVLGDIQFSCELERHWVRETPTGPKLNLEDIS